MNDTLYIIPTYERTKAIQPVLRSIENAGVPMDVFIMVKKSSPETRTRYADLFASMKHDGSMTVVDQDQNIGWDFIAWKAAIDKNRTATGERKDIARIGNGGSNKIGATLGDGSLDYSWRLFRVSS